MFGSFKKCGCDIVRERETMDYRQGAERFKINLQAIQEIRLHLSRKRNFVLIFIHSIELFNISFVSSALRRPPCAIRFVFGK